VLSNSFSQQLQLSKQTCYITEFWHSSRRCILWMCMSSVCRLLPVVSKLLALVLSLEHDGVLCRPALRLSDRQEMRWDAEVRARVGRLPSPVGSLRYLMVSSLSFHIRYCMSSLPSLAVSIPATSSRYTLLHFPFLLFFLHLCFAFIKHKWKQLPQVLVACSQGVLKLFLNISWDIFCS
jgi:hypothetical protein